MTVEFDNNDVERDLNTEVDVDASVDVDNDDNMNDDVENVSEDGSEENKDVAPLKKQSSKQDKAFATMRKELEAYKKEAENYRKLNQRVTNYGVKDLGEYFDKLEVQELQNRKEELKEQGYDEATIDKMLKAETENVKLKADLEAVKRQQYESSLMAAFESVQKAFPEMVKTVDDISDEVWALADKGYSLIHAYKIVNEDKIIEQKQAATKQKTLNNLNSKKHLKTESDGPGNASDTMIDPETLQGYLDMGFTKKEAIAHYKKIYG